jgi:hypothetical protein
MSGQTMVFMDRAAGGSGAALVRSHPLWTMPQTRWPEHSSRAFVHLVSCVILHSEVSLRLHGAKMKEQCNRDRMAEPRGILKASRLSDMI